MHAVIQKAWTVLSRSRTSPRRAIKVRANRSRLRRRTLGAEALECRRVLAGPYAPAADQPGTTAIDKDDTAIVAWATGWENYVPGTNVNASWQTPEKAIGPAVGDSFDIVVLGNNGQITLTFDRPIRNGAGWDFAVFENSFNHTFLELGFVEVSSDGVNFFRFANDSLTASPVGGFGAVDPTNITGYGGKYIQGFGTPFDLDELAGSDPQLNVNRITHVKIVDIVGDGTALDSSGDPIYDPHPTTGSAGFDLDAVGVIHQVEYVESTAGFEDVGATLADETYWYGPDPNGTTGPGPYGDQVVSGGFDSEGLQLNNFYSNDYGSWTGWGYSNTTDTTTPGFTNQMSAFPGSGADGSPTYAVSYRDVLDNYPPPSIDLADAASGKFFESLMVANTTYAVLSMMNGDSFAKKFGGPTGNDPDWFLLTITGKDADGVVVGAVEHYLADYRFADNSQDYIQQDWRRIDLASLRYAASLEFVVTSSDVGAFGMNTPAYVALDQVVVAQEKVPLELAASSISEGAGAGATMGTVGRNDADLSQPLVVNLSSSDPTAATVPATVTILAGAASAQFPINAVNDAVVDGTQAVTISASAAGYAPNTAALDVTDDDMPTLTLELDVSSVSEGAGAGAATATLSRNTSTAADLVVMLSSSDATAATVPMSVTILAGQTSVQFDVDAVDDELVDGDQTTTITASAAGFPDATDSLQVTDNDALQLTVTIHPAAISESDAPPTAQFEDVGATLAPESFWNGSDGSGGFETGGLAFNNNYNSDFGVWDGWSYSNTTDTTTPGFLNQYSAYPGSGANGSATYGVSFVGVQTPTIALTEATDGLTFHSLRVTNTTYAALSMRDGDAFAKKFGGETGADPDWFLLTIEGRDADDMPVGTVEFYLADFRSPDSQEDYIVQDWIEVDVSSLIGATQLAFSLSSSDVGMFGMNTPAFIAVDDIVLSDGSPAAATGTVTRNDEDLSQELIVHLSSDDLGEASVPTTVTIPANETSVQFPITAVDDAIVDGPQTATITASATNYLPGSETITVNDDDLAQLTLTIAADSVGEDAGAGATTAVIHRNTDLTNALTVTLASNDPSEAGVPATVEIPAGQSSAVFSINAVDDGLDDGLQTATITASAAGFSDGVDALHVTDDDDPTLALMLSVSSVSEGAGSAASTATLTRNTATTDDLVVMLSSSDTAAATVPATVTILAGQTSVQFPIDAVNDDLVDGLQTTTITASASGFLDGTAELDVTDDDNPQLTVSISPTTVSESDAPPTAQFEDVGATLAPESFWNGSDGSGAFETGGLHFNNNYNSDFDFWDGWAFSNTTNTATPGFLNQYSAYPGSGASGSATYGVAFAGAQPPTISLTEETAGLTFQSLRVTNTTYAALSMLNGDAFSKKFGGPTGDDPDWFLLTIEGLDENGASVGEVEFFLADYRFADSQDDYLVEAWTEVDVSSLSGAISLIFSLSSSDVGVFGMNTPAYLAVDDVMLSDGSPAPAMGTVTRNDADLTQELVVQLASSDTSEATVPTTVTIPANEASAQFPIAAVDDALVDGSQTAIITASADNYTPGSDSLTVTDDDIAQLTLTIGSESIGEAAGAGATTVVVHRNTDATNPLTVTLASSDTSEASVPTTVEILAGQASVTFSLDAVDDGVVDGPQTVTITASAAGLAGDADTLNVTDDDSLQLTVTIDPTTISESDAPPTAQFEDVGATLAPESFWNGSDGSGSYETGGLHFNNNYNTDYDFWDGWAFSNTTDTATPGFLNQYSAYAGSGASGSATYGVSFVGAQTPTISLTEETEGLAFQSLRVTNTTYAAFSMLNGDAFAKKFGGPTGDDPDWFLLTIEGRDADGMPVGEVEFYLADYRFADSQQDYLVQHWTEVDLSSLTGATQLAFSLTSSDVGQFGMNTPAYVAVDNVKLSNGSPAAAMGTVTRNDGDLSQPLTVQLVSSDSSEATVPATVTIPAGQASAPFSINAVDDALVDGPQTATITANAANYASSSEAITVNDDGSARLKLTIAPASVSENAGTVAGVIHRNTDTTDDLTVTLTNSDPTAATAPVIITIPAGQASAAFSLTTVDDELVDGDQTTTVVASATNFADAAATLEVTDNDSLQLTVTIDPTTISESDAPPTAQFEDVGATLAPESFWNGSDGSGSYETGGLHFNNNYNTDYDFWDGWAFSNTTDTATPGFLNQYSAYAGSGASGSATYGVAFAGAQPPTISLTEGTAGLAFQSVRVTNTTYAALSMLQGDAFAKKFGGPTGDDPDWFLLTIEGLDENGASVGEVEFYLADYRFTDSQQDYLVQNWTEVDVSSLIGATQLAFSLSSSDVGQFGMNTPAYVAVDDIVLSNGSPAAAMGTVTRNDADLSQPLTVQLVGSDASEATTPTTVTIPAGQASAQFPLDAVDDGIVDGTQTVTITATAAGYGDGADTIDVLDDDTPALTLVLSKVATPEGTTITGVVARNTPATADLTVSLSTSDSTLATLPTDIVIPAGESLVAFTIEVLDDPLVDGLQTLEITAQADGFTVSEATLEVTDNDVPALTVTIDEQTTAEGAGIGAAMATVTRNTDVTNELLVQIVSSDTTAALVPVSIVIPAGQASATFAIDAVNDDVVDGVQTATITASATGFTDGADSLDVTDDDTPQLNLVLSELAASEGAVITGQVTRNTDTSAPLTVQLLSDNPAEATVPSSVTIPTGMASIEFSLQLVQDGVVDGPQTANITAQAAGHGDGSAILVVLDSTAPWQNPDEPSDVNDSASVTLEDLLLIVTILRNLGNPYPLPPAEADAASLPRYPDPTGDGLVSLADLLAVVQTLRAQIANSPEGERSNFDDPIESSSSPAVWQQRVDEAFAYIAPRTRRIGWYFEDDDSNSSTI